MIRTLLWRPGLALLCSALAWGTYSATTAPATRAATGSAPVKIKAKEVNSKYVFGPTKAKIKVGQTIVWSNTTDAPHTVTSTTKSWTYDKKLNVGASLRFTFKKAGTFHYKCSFHPGMVGTVIVSH